MFQYSKQAQHTTEEKGQKADNEVLVEKLNVCEKELAQQQEVLAEREHTITALESMVSRKNDHLATMQEEKEGLVEKMAELEQTRHTQADALPGHAW